VDSAVIALDPINAAEEFGLTDRAAFLRFASACFRYKRKTLRNNLAGIYAKEAVDGMAEAGKRAEQLSVRELVALFRSLPVPSRR
jgi:16S rRNA A1518/A1519 N6-dimethyltransferase RsmA/KsgA/DIM1 with predicted DNA glycosylase/AP lyase activity